VKSSAVWRSIRFRKLPAVAGLCYVGKHERVAPTSRLSCEKCGRSGEYRKPKLIERCGADMRLPRQEPSGPTMSFCSSEGRSVCLLAASFRQLIDSPTGGKLGPNFGPKLADTRRNTVTRDALVSACYLEKCPICNASPSPQWYWMLFAAPSSKIGGCRLES